MIDRLRTARASKGWSLADVAARLDITELDAARIERNPTPADRIRLANLYGPALLRPPRNQ